MSAQDASMIILHVIAFGIGASIGFAFGMVFGHRMANEDNE